MKRQSTSAALAYAYPSGFFFAMLVDRTGVDPIAGRDQTTSSSVNKVKQWVTNQPLVNAVMF